MSDPTPLTDDELTKAAGVAGYLEREPQPWWDDEHVLDAVQAAVWIRRLLATVDAERARREQAEAEGLANVRKMDDLRMAEIKQLKAQRDAADSVIRHWHKHGFVRSPEMHTWTDIDWADSSWTAAEADAIRRALDASPTEGNPDE